MVWYVRTSLAHNLDYDSVQELSHPNVLRNKPIDFYGWGQSNPIIKWKNQSPLEADSPTPNLDAN